jgi:hypothetical protein
VTGLRFSTAGTYDLSDVTFSGCTTDVDSTVEATLVDSYQPTEDGDVDVYSGSITRVAQQFTGTVGDLSRAIWSIRKQGSPTGNVYAKLYENSGGAPTGSPLATSEAVSIEDLTTSFADVDFEFKDEYTLAATDYHISIEYEGGDSGNRLEVEYLTAGSGSETCNTYVSSWSGQTYDCRFQVNRDGIVKINNLGTTNASTYTVTATTKGTVIIVSSYTLTINVTDENGDAIENAQTAIYTNDSDRTELMNEDTDSLGVATETYTGSVPKSVEVRVRRTSPGGYRYIPFSQIATITSVGLTLDVRLRIDPNAVPAEEEVLMGGERITIGGERVIMKK